MKATRLMSTIGICIGGACFLYSIIVFMTELTDIEAGLNVFWFITSGYLLAQSIVTRVQCMEK